MSVIIVVRKRSGLSQPPWKMTTWIFIYSKVFTPDVNSTFKFHMTFVMRFMILSGILHILKHSIFQVCVYYHIYPTPPLGQDMTQGQFIKRSFIIIIIMSRRQRGYPWPSLAISPYHSSPPAGLQGYILCPHIVAVCMFVLVVPLLHIHMWGSTGVHRLWARPCFSSSVLRVWFVELV